MKVKDVLRKKSGEMITITADQSLLAASQLLAQHKIGALVVMDGADAPIGILSERDIVRELAEGKDIHTHTVGGTMTEDIITGTPDDDLSEVSTVMTDNRFRHLPILDAGQLVGMISIGDVVKAQLDNVAQEADMLRQYITST